MRDKTFKTIGIILTSILALVFVASLAGFIVLPLVTFILILVPDLIFLIILAVRLPERASSKSVPKISPTITRKFVSTLSRSCLPSQRSSNLQVLRH